MIYILGHESIKSNIGKILECAVAAKKGKEVDADKVGAPRFEDRRSSKTPVYLYVTKSGIFSLQDLLSLRYPKLIVFKFWPFGLSFTLGLWV